MSGLVSIIMPSYNTGTVIGTSIRSILQQSYTDWELIIVDDCSTDNTDRVVYPFLQDARIRYLKNENNSGAAYSRNRAIREAKGKWIAFLDSDDIWTPDKLTKQIQFMEENGYYFSYTKYAEINENGEKNGVIVSGPRRITKRGFYNYCWPGCLTVMYNAEKIGLIQITSIRKNNDYAMWLKICHKADCFLLDEVLAFYRRGRVGSISTQNYINLMTWHYRLFRDIEQQSILHSCINTMRNVIFGVYKKIAYVQTDENN